MQKTADVVIIGAGVNGVYYRPDSPGLTLVGGRPMESGANPDSFDQNTDHSFMEAVAEKISRCLPIMEQASYVRGWAGVFAVSADLHPLIGCSTSVFTPSISKFLPSVPTFIL